MDYIAQGVALCYVMPPRWGYTPRTQSRPTYATNQIPPRWGKHTTHVIPTNIRNQPNSAPLGLTAHAIPTNIRKGVALCFQIPPRWGYQIPPRWGYQITPRWG